MSYKRKFHELIKKTLVGKDLWLVHLPHKKSLIHKEGIHYDPSSEIWTCMSKGCQKVTQLVYKMKPNSVHIQAYVYKIIVMWLSHASTRQ